MQQLPAARALVSAYKSSHSKQSKQGHVPNSTLVWTECHSDEQMNNFVPALRASPSLSLCTAGRRVRPQPSCSGSDVPGSDCSA